MAMFVVRSPDTGEKRKRSGADSERPDRSTSPLPRLSPPTGHRRVQALAQNQYMPDPRGTSHEGAVREPPALTSGSDSNDLAKSGRYKARPSEPRESASELREIRLHGYQPQEEHSGTQAYFSHASHGNPRARLSTEDTITASPRVERRIDGKTSHRQVRNADMAAKSKLNERTCNGEAISMKPSGRPYLQFKDRSSTFGALIPDGWELNCLTRDEEDLPFPCPVRGCEKVYFTAKDLGCHFTITHRDSLFNDNLDGSLSIIATRGPNQQGCIVISQNPRSSEDGPPAELQLGSPASGLSQNALQDVANLSPASSQSVHTARSRTSVENQQTDKRETRPATTTWDAALKAYPCITDVFPTRPTNGIIPFLARLPAAEGALDISPMPKKVKGRIFERVFNLPESRSSRTAHLKAALAQSHGILSESPCVQCAVGSGLWETCMRAPTLPGSSQDVFDGACPSCFYYGRGNKCERRAGANSQQGLAPLTPVVASANPPIEEDRERNRRKAAQKAAAPPDPEDENSPDDRAQGVSVRRKESQDSKHKLQDQAFEFARRVRSLPLDCRQAIPERIESLLTMETFDLDALDMVRSVLEQPREERAQSTEMILQILRVMLV